MKNQKVFFQKLFVAIMANKHLEISRNENPNLTEKSRRLLLHLRLASKFHLVGSPDVCFSVINDFSKNTF